MSVVLYIVFALFISLAFLMIVTLNKKKDELPDLITKKSYITPICFLVAGGIGLIAHIADFLLAPVWWGIVIVVLIGSLSTKYLPKADDLQ